LALSINYKTIIPIVASHIDTNLQEKSMIKVVTINVLSDLDQEFWTERRDLLVKGLKEINPDIIGAQEINSETSYFLAQNLNLPYIYKLEQKGIAILSRYPFIQQEAIDLKTQGRFAQLVKLEVNNKQFIFLNGHYFWRPGSCQERMEQFKLLVDNITRLLPELPIINVGDFNAVPKTKEIKFLRNYFTSAYEHYHGSEPEYTCPTPLKKTRPLTIIIAKRIANIILNRQLKPWRGTLDYIFINKLVKVKHCQSILTEASPENPLIYPSDHFGIAADLEL
jgi:endonuclease/exonuclease/phosphatase family metal-dependent hydrolase